MDIWFIGDINVYTHINITGRPHELTLDNVLKIGQYGTAMLIAAPLHCPVPPSDGIFTR